LCCHGQPPAICASIDLNTDQRIWDTSTIDFSPFSSSPSHYSSPIHF
jgi:hypothetical protein